MTDYSRWTKEALVQRILQLEQSGPPAAAAAAETPAKRRKTMDPSRYATRFVALKMAYLGKRYGGFEHQPSGSLPTVEEELWKALVKGCLVFPAPGAAPEAVDFSVCDYSKCGRTDKGVSAFGQVVALRMRSSRRADGQDDDQEEEIDYPKVLNRLLPPDIRVLASCLQLPPDFSARFSCRERQYRYFFTQPAFFPAPSAGEEKNSGWLDIAAMREAAAHFVGLHDFRNFCKLDPTKQITNFCRRIFAADIVPVPEMHSPLACFGGPSPAPQVYSFDVRGSAFLWHQIRHMVAVLFLVGQGREPPSVVPALLDPAANPGRPAYGMAEEAPLVLWDCIFPPLGNITAATNDDDDESAIDSPTAGQWADSLAWTHVSDGLPASRTFVDGLWRGWRAAKMDEILANRLLDVVTGGPSSRGVVGVTSGGGGGGAVQTTAGPCLPPHKSLLFEGGDGPRSSGVYVPLLQRHRLASPAEINDRYAQQKGFASSAAMRETGNWRAVIKAQKAEAREKPPESVS